MNELGIVLVVVFTLILVFMFLSRGKKRTSDEKHQQSSSDQASSEQLSAENPVTQNSDTQVSSSAATSQKPQSSSDMDGGMTNDKATTGDEQTASQVSVNTVTDSGRTDAKATPSTETKVPASAIAEPGSANQAATSTNALEEKNAEANQAKLKQSEQPNPHGGKHFVLEVDDPAMTGELAEDEYPPAYQEPKFGRPDPMIPNASNDLGDYAPSIKEPVESAPEPKAFVLVIKTYQSPLSLEKIHQIMQGLGAKLNHKNLYTYATKPVQTDGYITIANLLEPGVFSTTDMQNQTTPGVVLILELPTFVTAQAAMHDMIMLARKLVQHFHGQILDENFKVIKESDLQSMREQSLEYDSQKIVT